ncbi:LAME_0H12728g1_1 [Lachancea meyersii CBS 8951]|uniref:LAME_0H12728g1_1 n=1 Tax=Lachancea meyersii CBS 8951 TaxID=1266667 RepID=A0A1G4KGS9_9SACH|nr:LAME_0H12728g1_1 [Lachancea meyersii CBS 8951]
MLIGSQIPGELISRQVSWLPSINNKTWRILAIVGIVIACLLVLWILGSFLRCCVHGAAGICEFCFWCCPRSRPHRSVQGQRPLRPPPPSYSAPMVIYQPIVEPESSYYREVHYDLESQKPYNAAAANEQYEFQGYPAHNSRIRY